MRIARSPSDSPTAAPTTLFSVEGDDDKNHLRLQQLAVARSEVGIDTGPAEGVDANTVELRIFSAIFAVFLLVVCYFVVKAAVRTWKRRNADYLLTWAHNKRKHGTCKCASKRATVSDKAETGSPLSPVAAKVARELEDEDEADAATGPPTTSSGVGTVDSSDASAETASTNPLLELLSTSPAAPPDPPAASAPPPSVTVAEITLALIHTSRAQESSASSDAPILRHNHHHHRHKRRVDATASNVSSRKRCSNSSPPSPVFPRRRSEIDDSAPGGSTLIQHHRHRRNDQHHRHPRRRAKRRVSLDAAEDRLQANVIYLYGIEPKLDTVEAPAPPGPSGLEPPVDRGPLLERESEWHPPTRTWVDDDDDAGSLSIPLSVATAPPDYFDTMNAEWERQGFCPLYKSHRTRGTVTVPGTP